MTSAGSKTISSIVAFSGRNTILWPDFTFNFRKEVARFEASDYAIDRGAPASLPIAAPQPVASAT